MATAHQVVKIKDVVKEWQKPANLGQMVTRMTYPFEHEQIPDAHVTTMFDTFMQEMSLTSSTRTNYQTALMRFMGMFEAVDGSSVDYTNLLLNILRTELFETLQSLDILEPEFSWTSTIILALGHFANMQKLRFNMEGNRLASDLIEGIIDVYLRPWMRAANAAKKRRTRRRH